MLFICISLLTGKVSTLCSPLHLLQSCFLPPSFSASSESSEIWPTFKLHYHKPRNHFSAPEPGAAPVQGSMPSRTVLACFTCNDAFSVCNKLVAKSHGPILQMRKQRSEGSGTCPSTPSQVLLTPLQETAQVGAATGPLAGSLAGHPLSFAEEAPVVW